MSLANAAKIRIARFVPPINRLLTRLRTTEERLTISERTLGERTAELDAMRTELDATVRKLASMTATFSDAQAKLETTTAELQKAIEEARRTWLRFRPAEHLKIDYIPVKNVPAPTDVDLIDRIVTAYQAARTTDIGSSDSFWIDGFVSSPKKPIHDALVRTDHAEVTRILRYPHESAIFFGFENTYDSALPRAPGLVDFWERQAPYDSLRRLAEILGVSRIENPENYYHGVKAEVPTVDQLIAGIEDHIGFKIIFPNPFIGEAGLATSRGVATYRSIQAIYQAFLIAKLVKGNDQARVLEIGGGLGRTAYYAWQFGVRDYTMIDIPMTAVAQAYFLGRTISESDIQLYGEPAFGGMRVLPPSAFLQSTDRYDLVVNVDSLTEMSKSTAMAYWQAITARSSTFLSINHESNDFTVRDIYLGTDGANVTRAPYSLREGYVEELVIFKRN